MVHDIQKMTYQGRYVGSEFKRPDFMKMAESFGVLGLRPEKPGEVTDAMRTAFAADRPAIVSVPIDPNEMPPAKARMMAMDRSLGNPPLLMQSLSLDALKTVWRMLREG